MFNEEEAKNKLRTNIIRELKKNHPKGFCYICGKGKKATIHHLRKTNRKGKGKVVGEIPLCRNCHDAVEKKICIITILRNLKIQ